MSARAGVARPDPSLLERGGGGLVSHGAAAADVDLDGRIDLFATGLHVNALFRNRGDGTFEDVAAAAGVSALASPGVAPLFLDFDDDGDPDLFVSSVGSQSLLENRVVPDGRLAFRDVTARAGVGIESACFSASAADVDGDGRTDVHVACYNRYGAAVVPDSWTRATNGLPDLVFLNRGGGRFVESARALGLDDARWGYACSFADVDGDGDLELHVANDFGGPDRLYVRGPSGRWHDEAGARGLGGPGYGMGSSFGDHDLDGDLDLHVTRMSSAAGERVLAALPPGHADVRAELSRLLSGNALLRNDGHGRFTDVSASAGPFRPGWGWGGGFVDLDCDGRPDLYVPSGFLSGTTDDDTQELFWRDVVSSRLAGTGPSPAFFAEQVARIGAGGGFAVRDRDLVALNRGDGTFADVSAASGLDSPTDGRAAVFADFDDDGDADVFLRAMHGQAHLLWRNDSDPARWLRVALRGTRSGRDACGATVRVRTDDGVLTQVKSCGSGFLSQHDPRLLFALGTRRVREIEVTWPSGRRQRFAPPSARSVLAVEGDAGLTAVEERPFQLAP